jgi:ferredoxin-NADP reductase/MOSC domain-containing protein YiiM
MPSLVSINVGLPRDIEWRGRTVHTAIWKLPVNGKLMAGRLNLAGDGQGDLAGHGGEHRAVMVYQLDSYRHWESHFGRHDFTFGQFGENFTVDGLTDEEVCIGDRYRIGGALFEVTQPRVTCYRVGIRMNDPQMAALLVSHKRPGFYLRVLEEGEVSPNDEIVKVGVGPEKVTVAEVNALLYLPGHSRESLARALRVLALSPGWRTSLKALAEAGPDAPGSQGGNAGLVGLAAPPAAWQGFRPLRVAKVDRENSKVLSFTFESNDRSPLAAALPGQFLVVKLNPAPDSASILRNYSLSSPAGADIYRVSVKREAKGLGSSFLHNCVHAGDVLEVSAPRGKFTLASGNNPVVFLSAGIGVTPVLSMLYSLTSAPAAAIGREVWWLYGAQNRSDHPFAQESRKLLAALPLSHTCVVYSKPGPNDRLGQDYDAEGHLNISLIRQLGVPERADFYLCGPPSFLKDLSVSLKEWGVDATRIHIEAFGSEGSLTPGISGGNQRPPHPLAETGTGPKVSFTRSGLTVSWSSRFESILELAEACDVPVRWSCRTGVCHTCECVIVGGAIRYRPDPLDFPGEGNILICCSQPETDIQIDI